MRAIVHRRDVLLSMQTCVRYCQWRSRPSDYGDIMERSEVNVSARNVVMVQDDKIKLIKTYELIMNGSGHVYVSRGRVRTDKLDE